MSHQKPKSMSGTISLKTPFYLYDTHVLQQTVKAAVDAADAYGYVLHYAMKANHNPVITQLISQYGLGADCVSGNEVLKALQHGFSCGQTVFAGVGKSDEEIALALENQILCLNCESEEELVVTESIARNAGKVARIAIRVNPGVEAHTHHYITTGLDENKFGVHLQHLHRLLEFAHQSPWIDFLGLHFHIGSQITDLQAFERLCHKINTVWREYRLQHYGARMLNVGGGLGVSYQAPEYKDLPDFESYFGVFAKNLRIPSGVRVHFELGRSLVAQCGKLVSKVLYTKKGVNRHFVILDAGMTELMRPALYQAVHHISHLGETDGRPLQRYDVAGPVCESSDVFARDIMLPATRRGDILAIHSCGAYGESMMLRYNLRPAIKSYFLHKGTITAMSQMQKNLGGCTVIEEVCCS